MKGANQMALIFRCMGSILRLTKSNQPPSKSKQPPYPKLDTARLIDDFTRAKDPPDPNDIRLSSAAKTIVTIYCKLTIDKRNQLPFFTNIKEDLVKKITEVFTVNNVNSPDIRHFFECLFCYLTVIEVGADIPNATIKSYQESPNDNISEFLKIVNELSSILKDKDINFTQISMLNKSQNPVLTCNSEALWDRYKYPNQTI